jgi:hypothetical protein
VGRVGDAPAAIPGPLVSGDFSRGLEDADLGVAGQQSQWPLHVGVRD